MIAVMVATAVVVLAANGRQNSAAALAGSEDAGVHQSAVNLLRDQGVFEGTECTPGSSCPNQAVRRWTVAVWLVRIVDGEEPDHISGHQFVDVDAGEWWAPHVQRLAQVGITVGCSRSPARFCPEGNVTRAQLATFLTRAFNLPSAPPAGFIDTVGNTHERGIDSLAAAGITMGCSTEPRKFCPDDPVSRGQMASLLVRASPQEYEWPDQEPIAPTDPQEKGDNTHESRKIRIPVYYCAATDAGYTLDELRQEAYRLTHDEADVGQFYFEQSSGLVSLEFYAAEILSPNVDWETETLTGFSEAGVIDPCSQAIFDHPSGETRAVVLVDLDPGAKILGYAWPNVGPTIQPTMRWFDSNRTVYSRVLAHELGHMLWDLRHPHDDGYSGDCSLMAVCGYWDLRKTHIANYQKEILGWP